MAAVVVITHLAPLTSRLVTLARLSSLALLGEVRVILMHIDSETPSLATFAQELRSDFCKERPAVAAEIELAGHDEASHARFGKTWFEHLVPEKANRKVAVERALLLRGVLMLTAFSHYHDTPLLEMMTRFSAPDAPPAAAEPS